MSDPPADLREPLEEAGGNWDSLCGHRCEWHPFGGAHRILIKLVPASKFGVLPLAY